MRNPACALLPVCFILIGILTACNQAGGNRIDILHIEGASWASNVTSSYGWFGASPEFEEEKKLTLAASDGDLLYLLLDDLDYYYRYNSKDGANLKLTFDTLGAFSVYLNGELNYMALSDPPSLEAFSLLTAPEIAQLSTLNVDGTLAEELIPLLQGHESQLQGLGLVLESGSPFPDLNELLVLCRPELLVLHNSNQFPEPDGETNFEGLELLWIEERIPSLSKTVACCGDLESLIISGWEPQSGEILPLSTLRMLRNLTLAESKLTSLKNIEFPESLQSLNLISCDTLSHMDQIKNLPELYRLSLTACDKLTRVILPGNPESLRWISFPESITQQEFETLCPGLPGLEVVEAIDCPGIENLLPIQELEDLRILALQLEQEQLSGLNSLTQLELLILTDDLFMDNSYWINELRASLPATQVVPGSGLCLGSGWLLLLLPLILLFRMAIRRKA
jgi:hypothetical protein